MSLFRKEPFTSYPENSFTEHTSQATHRIQPEKGGRHPRKSPSTYLIAPTAAVVASSSSKKQGTSARHLPDKPISEARETEERETQERDTPEETVRKDWCGRGQHVEFRRDEQLPLEQGDVLGHGSNGFVCKTICKGVAVAWKRKVYATNKEPLTLKEKDILMRLDHMHIVKLVGTYQHPKAAGRLEVGLLTWPVAVCDLSAFITDLDELTPPDALSSQPQGPIDRHRRQRIEALGIGMSDSRRGVRSMRRRMLQSIGCLTAAMEYLHDQNIRHKDMKPANILLYQDNIRLTDFGNSIDFSQLNTSATETGALRGSPRYFAPESASYSRTGRAADIFALGCVFLEMVHAYAKHSGLQRLERLRPGPSMAYHANLAHVAEWTYIEGSESLVNHLLAEIRPMLAANPDSRPKAKHVVKTLSQLGQMSREASGTDPVNGPCCSTLVRDSARWKSELGRAQEEIDVLSILTVRWEQEKAELMEQVHRRDRRLREHEAIANAVETEARHREAEYAQTLHEAEENHKLYSNLQIKVSELEKDLEESQSQVERLESALTTYMKSTYENTRLKKEIRGKNEEIPELQADISWISDDFDTTLVTGDEDVTRQEMQPLERRASLINDRELLASVEDVTRQETQPLEQNPASHPHWSPKPKARHRK